MAHHADESGDGNPVNASLKNMFMEQAITLAEDALPETHPLKQYLGKMRYQRHIR
jgi:hypothetical protein